MKKAKILVILVSLCLLLTACQYSAGLDQLQMQQYNGEGTSDGYNVDYDILDKGPVPGGVLNLFTTVPDTLNPILTKNVYVSDFLNLIYEGLTSLDEKQQAVPKLSDMWTVSDDGLIWNFHIRDNVKWQDGQPFTASDVEFTVQLLMNTGIDSAYKPLVQNIATCTAVDSSNFKLVLTKPNSFLPEMMTFPILPKHQFKQSDVLTSVTGFSPIGTGPYKFEAYTDKKQVRLKADKNWWYLGIGDNGKNSMYIDTVNVNVFNSANDAMGALQTGEVDVFDIDSADISKYRGRTDLTMKKYTSREFEMLTFNLKNPVMSDKYARKAISLAIDKNKLIEAVLPGDAMDAEIPMLPESWMSDLDGVTAEKPVFSNFSPATSQSAIAANASTNSALSMPTVTDSAVTMNAVKDSAVAVNAANTAIVANTPGEALQAGGWKASNQGWYKTIGGIRRYLRVEILVNSNNVIRVQAAQNICSQLTLTGIPAVCTQVGWNDLLARTGTGKYDIAFIGCRIPQIPDISYLYSGAYLPTLMAAGENAYNISGYFNLQVDTYINEIFKENNTDRKKALFKGALDLISNDTPYIGLYFTRNAIVYGKNLRGPVNPDTWNRFNDIIHWYKPQQQ